MSFIRLFSVTLIVALASCDKQPAETPAASAPHAKPSKGPTVRPGPKQREPRRRPGVQEPGGIVYHRSRFLQKPLTDEGLSPVRRMGPLTDDLRAELKELITLAAAKPTRDEALKLIDRARDMNSLEVLPLIKTLLGHADPDVRGNALSLLEGIDDRNALGVIALGLKDSDADVRIMAAETAGRIVAPDVAPVLQTAFNDSDISVRQLAFQAALRQDDSTRFALIEAAMKSRSEDLAQAGIGILEAQPSKVTVPLIMDALGSQNGFIREKAHDILFLTFHEDFSNVGVAKGWWLQNHRRFDDGLVLTSP